MHHIYHLVDPRDGTVRYIGKTTNPTARLNAHIQDARAKQNTEKKRWITALIAQGRKPLMVIAARTQDDSAAREIESAHCHQHADTIYNIHDPLKGAKDLKRDKIEQ